MDNLTWDYILKYVIVGDVAVGKSSILIRLTDDRFSQGGTEPTLGVEFGSRILTVGDQGKRVKVQCWDTAGTESFRSITRSYFRGAAGALLVYDVTKRETFQHVTTWLQDLRAHADENVSIILVANKTDLCTTTPPELPLIQYGQAVSIDPSSTIDTSLSTDTDPRRSSSSSSHSTPTPSLTPTPPKPLNTESKATIKSTSKSKPNINPQFQTTTKAGTESQNGLKVREVSTNEGAMFAKEHGLLYVETSAKEGWGVVDAFEWTAREVLIKVTKAEMERKRGGKVNLGDRDQKERKGGCC